MAGRCAALVAYKGQPRASLDDGEWVPRKCGKQKTGRSTRSSPRTCNKRRHRYTRDSIDLSLRSIF